MPKFIRLSCQISNQIISYHSYFPNSLIKLRSLIENPLFISNLNGMQYNFCNPGNKCNSIVQHQLLSLFEILSKLYTDLSNVDINFSDECKDFLNLIENFGLKILERECVKVMS